MDPLCRLLAVPDGAGPDALAVLVEEAHGRAPDPGTTKVEDYPYAFGSPATAGLHRIRGTTSTGEPWSLFCKELHHVRHWPGLAAMPPPVAAQFAAEFPWRTELELWDPRVQASLPDGLRSPVLHRLVDLGDDRLAVWQEDVGARLDALDLDGYAAAAGLVGRWNARSTAPEVLAVATLPRGLALRMYAERAVPFRGLAPLADDALWSHPWLVGHADLRADLQRLGARIPAMLDRLDTLPQTLPHGDASPQNLLVPSDPDDPATFVVIDLSFRTAHALGFDLGQLLVGLTHAGLVPAAGLPAIAARILPAYVDGLAAEGLDADADTVRDGFTTSVLLRSGFDGLLWELLGVDEQRAAFDERVLMSRFLVDQYDAAH